MAVNTISEMTYNPKISLTPRH